MVQEKSHRPREKQREGFAVPMAQALAQDKTTMTIDPWPPAILGKAHFSIKSLCSLP